MGNSYDIEASYNIWDNTEGVALTVGPDSDGCDWVQISPHHTKKSRDYFGENVRLVMPPAMARKVGEALIRAANDAEAP